MVELAKKELIKYNLTGWLPTFVSDAGSNVRRALAGRISDKTFREGGNLADWARCVCHMLHNIVSHALKQLDHLSECKASSLPGPEARAERQQ